MHVFCTLILCLYNPSHQMQMSLTSAFTMLLRKTYICTLKEELGFRGVPPNYTQITATKTQAISVYSTAQSTVLQKSIWSFHYMQSLMGPIVFQKSIWTCDYGKCGKALGTSEPNAWRLYFQAGPCKGGRDYVRIIV